MVVKTTKDGVVQLYLNGELKLEQAEVGPVTIGSYYDETDEKKCDYDTAFVGKGASLIGQVNYEETWDTSTLVNVSVDGSIIADEGARIAGINISGGSYSGSAFCQNASGSYGAGICLSATDSNGDYLYYYAGAEYSDVRGVIDLTGATFSVCEVNSTGYPALGGAIETYGGWMTAKDSLFSGNTANGTGSSGGAMALMFSNNTITGSTFSANKAYFGGAIQQQNGSMTVSDSLFLNNASVGDPSETYAPGGGAIELHEGAEAIITGSTFSSNTARSGGAIYNDTFNEFASDTTILGSTFSQNSAEVEGGAIYNFGVMTVSDSVFAGNTIIDFETTSGASLGGAISNTADGTMTVMDCTFSGNTARTGGAVWNAGKMNLIGITLETASDTIYNSGSMSFAGENTFGAEVVNDGKIAFDVISDIYTLLDDLGKFGGTGTYLLNVSPDVVSAGGLFAASAGTFSGSLSVYFGETATADSFTLNGGIVGNDLAVAGDTALRLIENSGALTVKQETLEKLVPAVSKDGSVIVWTDGEYAGGFWVEIGTGDSFGNAIRILTDGKSFDVVSRAGDYSCRATEREEAFAADSASWTASAAAPRQVESNANGRSDIFFASVGENDVWSSAYQAMNAVTGEIAEIAGKNRIRDTFSGSESDANILYLSDTANGDALFMDDVYSQFGDAARLARIREIRSGAGDDIVDMTSDKYDDKLAGMTVRGGAGDDVVWGNQGTQSAPGSMLFGDDGNDRIAGGVGDDVIAGGAGDDILNGGGGNDTFTFGENWGNDVVSQAAGGSVTLWFAVGDESKWDAASLTYSDGDNSVTVSGVTADKVTLMFGSEKEAERFAQLSAEGAFLGSTSEAVFETETARTQGILASL